MMGEAHTPKSALSRRSFLKTAGAAGALAAAGAMTGCDGWLKQADGSIEAEEKTVYVAHRFHCRCFCSLKVTVRDGRVCLIEPNDAYEDKGYRHICSKGLSEVQHIYSKERIQTPLKRVGERGEGKFESITWDEAYDMLMDMLKDTWGKYGRAAVCTNQSTEVTRLTPFLARLLQSTAQGNSGIDHGIGNGRDVAFGKAAGTTDAPGGYEIAGGWGGLTNEFRDFVNTKYFLFVGVNTIASVQARANMLLDAHDAGAKFVCVDPHYSQLAAKSDEWVPIEPGTDAAFYMGMGEAIIRNKWYDESFMKARTGFAFLINAQTGERLIDVAADGDQTGVTREMVWDNAAQRAVVHTSAQDPALFGQYEIDGVTYKTVIQLWADYLSEEMPVEKAAKLTHIPAEKIEEIAHAYATSGASALLYGLDGIDKFATSDIAGHAIAALVGLTGNIGKPGGNVGAAGNFFGHSGTLASWPMPNEWVSKASTHKFFDLGKKVDPFRMAIISGDTLLNKRANFEETMEWIKGLDHFVFIDLFYTSAVDYADLVLPACSPFESEEKIMHAEPYGGYVQLRQKAIDPLFQSKTDYQMQVDIAERLGLRDYLPASREEWVRYCLDNTKDPTIKGITLDSLIAHHGVQAQSCQSTIRRAYVDRFGTPSKKLDIYYDAMLPYGQSLPKWEENLEVNEDSELRKKYPLAFNTIKSKYRIHNSFWDAEWLNDFEGAEVYLNGIDLETRNLKSGDTVRVFNDRGEFVTKVLHDESCRPGNIRMHTVAVSRSVISGCFQNITNSDMVERQASFPLGCVINYNDVLVEVKKA